MRLTLLRVGKLQGHPSSHIPTFQDLVIYHAQVEKCLRALVLSGTLDQYLTAEVYSALGNDRGLLHVVLKNMFSFIDWSPFFKEL